MLELPSVEEELAQLGLRAVNNWGLAESLPSKDLHKHQGHVTSDDRVNITDQARPHLGVLDYPVIQIVHLCSSKGRMLF